MNKLENIVAYFCLHYPHKNELSKARLTKLVYLTDWFSALTTDKQMTKIEWLFNHYGPYVNDITNIAKNNNHFRIEHTSTHFGTDKHLISYISSEESILLSELEIAILDFVIKKTKDLSFRT